MHRFTRHTGIALAAVALMTGVTSACSGSPAESKTPQPRKTTSSSASPAAQSASPSDREDLNEEARDLLRISDRWDADEKGLVSSGSLALPGENLDETVKPGTALRVEVACAGEGTVTFTVVSGTAKTTKRVDCRQPKANGFDFTTAGSSLAIQADSPDEDGVGTAYVVSRTT
jgi:hypothetical protein